VQTAFFEGLGECVIYVEGEKKVFSDKFELDGSLLPSLLLIYSALTTRLGLAKPAKALAKF
jgi:excinuclease ABC subunit A